MKMELGMCGFRVGLMGVCEVGWGFGSWGLDSAGFFFPFLLLLF